MSRSQVVSLVAILAAAAAGGAWWLHANHKLPALAALDLPAGLGTPDAGKPDAAETPVSKPDAAMSGAAKPDTTKPDATKPAVVAAIPAPAKPTQQPAPAPAAAAKGQPSFDIVRVEPKGDTVVAGKGAPNTKVALLAGGRKVGEAVSDASGQFVILPAPLPPGDYALTLRQEGDAPADSKQSVAVSVPQPGKGAVVVALAEPGKATKLLSGPPAAAAAPLPSGKVAIVSAELENGTGFYVTGTAQAGAPVHVYLNDAHLADVVAGADGGWSVRVKQGLTGGHYVVRADVGAASGRVTSRAEVPFDVPLAMATAPKPPAPAAVASDAPAPTVATAPSVAGAATTTGAAAVIETVATARVTTGDNLWSISRFRLGDGKRYTQIYAANAGQIRNPDLIYPGQVFVVPRR